MSTTCYAMVRGSTLRVTGLRANGKIPSEGPVRAAVSRAVAKVALDEVNDTVGAETMRDELDQPRVRLPGIEDNIGYTAVATFLRVNPGLINLLTSDPVALDASGNVIGFDRQTRLPATSFGLEVWSKLSGVLCADGQKWGYTLFSWLRGGYLSGFVFGEGVVSFTLTGAMTQRGSRWNVGPHDLEGPYERLLLPVSGNGSWTTGITAVAPPEDSCGVVEWEDTLDNGTSPDPMPDDDAPDSVDGGGAVSAGPDWIVDGGGA